MSPLSLKKISPSAAVVLISLFVLGIVFGTMFEKHPQPCKSKYALLNTVEVCGKSDVISKADYIAVRNRIESFISEEEKIGDVASTSVYFRDLEDGPTFSINENADFVPASLLKVPLALVYLTQAEEHPDLMKSQVSVAKPLWNFSEYYPPSQKIDPSVPHNVEDLLGHMLTYSDNNAYGVLQTHLYETGQQDSIRQTFLELGFIDPTDINDQVMSVRQYAGIFRALYNVSYLNAEDSEKVLGWLSKSDFVQGLRGGVPTDVPIAHKFGERFAENGAKQLHDCGIVYYPENPYLLCVMTSGTDFDKLARIIQHVSGLVYQEVSSRRLSY